jgi:hypothetical protein
MMWQKTVVGYYPDIYLQEQTQTTKHLSQNRLSTELRVERWISRV